MRYLKLTRYDDRAIWIQEFSIDSFYLHSENTTEILLRCGSATIVKETPDQILAMISEQE